MKKKLSLLLAAAMIVGMVPTIAFARTDNYVDRVVTAQVDDYITNSTLTIEDDKNDLDDGWGAQEEIQFELDLTGAEWGIDPEDLADPDDDSGVNGMTNLELEIAQGIEVAGTDTTADEAYDGNYTTTVTAGRPFNVAVRQLTARSIVITLIPRIADMTIDEIRVPLYTQITSEEEASVRIDKQDSMITSESKVFATVVEGSTNATIEDTIDMGEDIREIKPIIITETAAGAIDRNNAGLSEEITLRLSGNFEFDEDEIRANFAVDDAYGNATLDSITAVDEDEISFQVDNLSDNQRSRLVITGVFIKATKDAEAGDVAEITVRGAVAKEDLEVATYEDYALVMSVEDEELPIIYSGTNGTDNETLEITLEESIADSWLSNRKTTIAFPDGVRIVEAGIDVKKVSNIDGGIGTVETAFAGNVDREELTFTIDRSDISSTSKAKIQVVFQLAVAPDFTGDITATLSGGGMSEEQTVTVAKAESPITVTADVNEVMIDYRNTPVSDITITENVAGALGSDEVLILGVDNMSFESGFDYEIVEGDIKIDEVKRNSGRIEIYVDSESNKTPSTIKITGLQLYLDRSLPAGNYPLLLLEGGEGVADTDENGGNAFFRNFFEDADRDAQVGGVDAKAAGVFKNTSLAVIGDYVEVITAGRESDDATFTTTLSVTIGATEMTVGNSTVALNAPAYISNGYTMLPLRAISTALSNSCIVTWDDATKTATVIFGQRAISMTIGSNIMTINGTPMAMDAAPEITNGWTYLPLRDLGHALGLSDDKIQWDDATKTATLN